MIFCFQLTFWTMHSLAFGQKLLPELTAWKTLLSYLTGFRMQRLYTLVIDINVCLFLNKTLQVHILSQI